MLGNDVVDLLDVDARPETFRRRFDERVFADEERSALAQDAAAFQAASGSDSRVHALRWAHWAAKEAAYKLLRQVDPGFVFSPRRLVARFEPTLASEPTSEPTFERRGRLEVVGVASPLAAALSLRSFETRDYVHVVALPADADWQAVTLGVEAMTPPCSSSASTGAERVTAAGQASAAVRELALRVLARKLGVDVSRLVIGRCGRIPTVELDGRTLSIPLSLSHHGRFVAFAAALRAPATFRARDARDRGVREREDRDERDPRTAGRDGTVTIDAKAIAFAGRLRGISRVRIASVRRTSGEGGGPFASADTAWMVG